MIHGPIFGALRVLVASSVLAVACSGDRVDPVTITELPESDQDGIRNAPATAEVGGVEISLEAEAWRNGMPGSDDDGLILSTTLVSKSGTMPAGIVLEAPFVVQGTDVWAPDYTDENRPTSPGRLERVARKGPDWKGGAQIDIVVRFTDGAGHTLFLAKRATRIENPV
jgi:hypothetical protein